jgi:hypothetical protein
MVDPRTFHEPYLARNRELLALLTSGDRAKAVETLADYLDIAERQLVEAYGRQQPVTTE